MAALAVCGAAISDDIKLRVKQHSNTWQEAARLWVALVGLPSSKKTPLMTGDIILLCTDGVWGPLPSDVIPRALSTGNVVQATPALLK